ncbi:MAG: hypothetical protein R3C49_21635 [Planctomycetaceae bacterium]
MSASVPTREADYRFVALATRSTEVITFQDRQGSQPAHYRLQLGEHQRRTRTVQPAMFSATIPAV